MTLRSWFLVVMTQEILMSCSTHRIRIIDVIRPPTSLVNYVGLGSCVILGLTDIGDPM